MYELFKQHLETVVQHTTAALKHVSEQGIHFEGIVFHAGTSVEYYADDHAPPFQRVPHFARFAPVPGPDHLVIFRPNQKVRLLHVVPQDFWYEAPAPLDHPYREVLEVAVVGSFDEAVKETGNLWQFAYIGNDSRAADALGLPVSAVDPKPLVAALDWYRAYKTPYEVACIRQALEMTKHGYTAVKAMVNGANLPSERTLHQAYLAATEQLEYDTPYGNIIGWDEASAILHYTAKRKTKPQPAHTLLIDAGCAAFGYASDITRTYFRGTPHPVFANLLDRMDVLELDCVERCTAGANYADVHVYAHKQIAEMLYEVGVLKVNGEEAFEKGLSRVFYPHGLGHHLGIQVHDVGGRQVDLNGKILPPDEKYPWLRTTRPIEVGHVLTVEPGLYFIPLLLDPQRTGEHKDCFNWNLVDELVPLGGIRVEDNILVRADGVENLSRAFIGDHR